MSKNKKSIKTIKIEAPNVCEYSVSVSTPKERDKYIKNIERIVRSSMEYRDYISFLKNHIDMDKCAFFQQISSKESKHVKVEIHHEPFTLYDIVNVVLQKFIDNGESLNDLLIADEVLELHYSNLVGLIPLSKTVHKLVHNSTKITIPIKLCYGSYDEFLEKYEDVSIIDELYDKLEHKIISSQAISDSSFDDILNEFTYLEVEGFGDPEKIKIEENQLKIA